MNSEVLRLVIGPLLQEMLDRLRAMVQAVSRTHA
jgi:hypothetical protein